MRTKQFVTFALSLSLAACASAGTANNGGSATIAPENTKATANANRITADEIVKADVATAYDAVYQLHRPWFRDMSAGASGDVFVYVDNRAVDEGKDALRQIPAHEVASIEYLKASDAVLRFGRRASGGAIIVTRK
jgi:hypothetical protein